MGRAATQPQRPSSILEAKDRGGDGEARLVLLENRAVVALDPLLGELERVLHQRCDALFRRDGHAAPAAVERRRTGQRGASGEEEVSLT